METVLPWKCELFCPVQLTSSANLLMESKEQGKHGAGMLVNQESVSPHWWQIKHGGNCSITQSEGGFEDGMWVSAFTEQTAAGVLLQRRTWRWSDSRVEETPRGWDMPTLVQSVQSVSQKYTGWQQLVQTTLMLLFPLKYDKNQDQSSKCSKI